MEIFKPLYRLRTPAAVLALSVFLFACGMGEDDLAPGGTALTGSSTTGSSLFTSNGCGACHGSNGAGDVGPNIQGATPDMIVAMAGNGRMSSVSVTAQEATDLSAYLETLTGERGASSGGVTLVGDATNGAQLFQDNFCFSCHGTDATGGIGPNIQADTVERISNFVGVIPPMDSIELTDQDRADIVAWLQTL